MTAITINLQSIFDLTDEKFAELCYKNQEVKFEKTATGELIVMTPTGSETGEKNSSLTGQLWFWNQRTKLGIGFDSSTGFTLPNGAIRSPDAAWIKKERWEQLSKEERRKFAPICPDFVIELLSVNDNWYEGQKKMEEYKKNGVLLGWLLDAENKRVGIYRQNQEVEIVENPTSLSGEDVLPEFVLDLSEIFD